MIEDPTDGQHGGEDTVLYEVPPRPEHLLRLGPLEDLLLNASTVKHWSRCESIERATWLEVGLRVTTVHIVTSLFGGQYEAGHNLPLLP